MSRRFSLFLERLPLAVLWIGVVGATALFSVGMFGGFDFTDEGSYYLSFAHPTEQLANNTSYALFGGALFHLLGQNIVALRACTLLATLGATACFFQGWQSFVRRFYPPSIAEAEQRRFAWGAVLIASFAGYGISPPAPSYNFQNAVCLLAAGGFLLAATARPASARKIDVGTLGPLALFGLFTAVDFFVKFSTSIMFLGCGGAFFLVVSEKKRREKAALAGTLFFCLGVVGTAYFILFQSFGHWWLGIRAIAVMVTSGGHTPEELRRYGGEILGIFATTLRYFLPVWVVAGPGILIVGLLHRHRRWQVAAAIVTGVWLAAHAVWLVAALGYATTVGTAGLPFFIGMIVLLLLLAVTSGFVAPGRQRDSGLGRWRLWCGAALLFILPYLGSFGTSNNVNQNCLYQLAPWFALASVLLAEIDCLWGSVWPTRLGVSLLAAVAGGQYVTGYWMQPYRVSGDRFHQTAPTLVGSPGTMLRLSPAAHEFIVTSRRVLQEHGFKIGDDLLVLFDLPGFVYALGGSSPGHYWYFNGDQTALDDTLLHLQLIAPERRAKAFIVRNSSTWDEFLPDLRKAGLHFPEDYQLITPPMLSPFTRVPFEIWQPKAGLNLSPAGSL
jgi:hypothetical protein